MQCYVFINTSSHIHVALFISVSQPLLIHMHAVFLALPLEYTTFTLNNLKTIRLTSRLDKLSSISLMQLTSYYAWEI